MNHGLFEAQVANSSWEDLVRTRIFQPLDMPKSNFFCRWTARKARILQSRTGRKKDVVSRVPFKNISAIGPAGSINSSINEMSHYVILHLGDGTYSGKRIVSQKQLVRLVHTGQTAMTSLPEFFYAKWSRAHDVCHGVGRHNFPRSPHGLAQWRH